MSKKSTLPQSRRHVMMYDEDWEFLTRYWEQDPQARPSPGVAVRELVHRRVMAMKEEINARLSNGRHAAPYTPEKQKEILE